MDRGIEREKRHVRRRRRKKPADGSVQAKPSRLLEPLSKPRRLDWSRPASEPLTPEEREEAAQHLAFLRLHKGALRLALNAAEDLLINGARPPTDRGLLKHLFDKVDRKVVERALLRDVLRSDVHQRARFLAGIVRLNPEISFLLRYLETLAEVSDRREAAAAFSLTIDRIDFDQVSSAQMTSVLGVIAQTFEGYDRVQALFGLLDSESFVRALERTLEALPATLQETLGSLCAAHRVVLLGERPPSDDVLSERLNRGVRAILAAPDRALRSYPLEIRKRLAEFVIRDRTLAAEEIPRSLLDSLPHHDVAYAELGLVRAEQLLASHQDEAARALLSQVVQSHPNLARAGRRLEALSWPCIGRLAFQKETEPRPPGLRLLRGFWLDGFSFVWARIAAPDRAGSLVREAQLQANLHIPGVAPAVAHGLGGDGKAFVAIAPGGRPFDAAWIERLRLHDALFLALEAVRILRGLAMCGVEIPDAAPERFLFERGSPHGLRIADFDGAVERDPGACAIAHGPLAAALCRRILSGSDGRLRVLPSGLTDRLRGTTPLAVLARTLAEHAARALDHWG